MRVVSPELAAAIEAPERVFRTTGSIDWDGDGHTSDSAAPLLIRDGFGRDVSNGLGTPDTGPPYTIAGGVTSDYGVSGGFGNMALTTVAVERTALLANVGATVDVTVYIRPTITATGAQFEQKIRIRYNGSTWYESNIQYQTDGTIAVYLVRGVTVLSALGLVLPYNSSTTYGVRMQAFGSTIRQKVWDVVGPQPDAWTATVTDTVAPGNPTDSLMLVADRITGNTNTGLVVQWDALRIVAGNIDDITGKIDNLTITRALTGQLPAEVLVVEGISAATASSNLVKGLVGDERLGAVQYWSRLNPGSPLFGKPRASRDVRLAVEFLTSNGMQSVPLLTRAVLRGLPVSVKDRRASLQLIDARDRFRTPVSLPAFTADEPWDGVGFVSKPGLEAGWPVSYALWRSGWPLSPPARTGCRLWVPAHGSLMPFIGRDHVGGLEYAYTTSDLVTLPDRKVTEFAADAPFFLATTQSAADVAPRTMIRGYLSDAGPALWNASGRGSGRIEVWAKIPAAPSNTNPAVLVNVFGDGAGGMSIVYRVQRDGATEVRINSGIASGVTRTVTGPTYTHDGQWHLYGVHWDDVAGSATFRRDATSNVVAYTPHTSANTPVTSILCEAQWDVPAAELQVTTGITAAAAWQPTTWASGVVVDRPQNRRLTGVYPADTPPEAWTLLQQVYGAERGLVFVDPDGTPQLWSAARLNTADALTPVRTITSTRNLLSLGYVDSRDMIRNIIRVPYAPVTVLPSAPLWTLDAVVRIAPGQTWTMSVRFDKPIASAAVLSGDGNTFADATGTSYAVHGTSPVRGVVTVTSPTSATVTVTNTLATAVFLIDVSGPSLRLSAQMLSRDAADPVEVRDQQSIDEYGPSPLDVPDNPWSQTQGWALGVAYGLLALLRDEQLVYTDIEIPGDPRLAPLDRLRVVDPDGLVLDTPVTLQQRSDKLTAGGYTSTLIARPSRDRWVLGGPGVGTPLGSTILGGTP